RAGSIWVFDPVGAATAYVPPSRHFQVPRQVLASNVLVDSRAGHRALTTLVTRPRLRDISLWALDLPAGKQEVAPLFPGGRCSPSRPVISADGSRVLVGVGPGPFQHESWRFFQGQRRKMTRDEGLTAMALHLTGAPH